MARVKIGRIKVPTRDDLVKFSKTEPTGENKPLLWIQPTDGENDVHPVVSIEYDSGARELVLTHSNNTKSRVDVSSLSGGSDTGTATITELPPLKNNVPLYGLDTDGSKWALIKLSSGNGTEVGHKDKPLAFSASRLTWWDGNNSRTILSTKELDGVGANKDGKVIYRTSEIDKMFKDVLDKLKDINSKL
jgi:hypothetical protein